MLGGSTSYEYELYELVIAPANIRCGTHIVTLVQNYESSVVFPEACLGVKIPSTASRPRYLDAMTGLVVFVVMGAE
jgi:hypothetical protein